MIIFTKHADDKFKKLEKHQVFISKEQVLDTLRNPDLAEGANMKAKKLKIEYEPEADILSWEVNKKNIDYASEVGNVIIHFTKDNQPVLFELLNASKFLRQAENLVGKQRVHA